MPLLALLGGLGLLLAGCSRRATAGAGASVVAMAADDPGDFGPVPAFRLISQTGQEVTEQTLRGSPFVLSAIFTRCTGPCPALTRNMARMQEALEGTDARLVSVSVDPEYDTPERLGRYAESYGADPRRWLFLTGSEQEVDRLLFSGFMMGVGRDVPDDVPPGQRVTHDTRLVAVDRAGRKRGWYSGQTEEGLAALRARMLYLAQEKPTRERAAGER